MTDRDKKTNRRFAAGNLGSTPTADTEAPKPLIRPRESTPLLADMRRVAEQRPHTEGAPKPEETQGSGIETAPEREQSDSGTELVDTGSSVPVPAITEPQVGSLQLGESGTASLADSVEPEPLASTSIITESQPNSPHLGDSSPTTGDFNKPDGATDAPGSKTGDGGGGSSGIGRQKRSASALGAFLNQTFASVTTSPLTHDRHQGRAKYNLNFPPLMFKLIVEHSDIPASLAKAAAIWALNESPAELSREFVQEAAHRISDARKRHNNPDSVTHPVTLQLPGQYNTALQVALKRYGLTPIPFFEAVTLLYIAFLKGEN